MKKKALLLSLASIMLLAGCGTKSLTKEEALTKIETMKQKVDSGDIKSPSKYVYTFEEKTVSNDLELHERKQILVDYDASYFAIENVEAKIYENGLEDEKLSKANSYFLFIKDNQLIYAKTTVLKEEYCVLYEGSSSSDPKLKEELIKYFNKVKDYNFSLSEYASSKYNEEFLYDLSDYKTIFSAFDFTNFDDKIETTYEGDGDIKVKTGFVTTKGDEQVDFAREVSFSNYLLSNTESGYIHKNTKDNKTLLTYNCKSTFQFNVAYKALDVSTFSLVDSIDFIDSDILL